MSQPAVGQMRLDTASAGAGPVSPTELEVRLLGEFSVRQGETPLVLPPSTWRLVALLTVERRLWSRARLSSLLWPDHEELRAHANLRTVLWRLRQSAPSLIEVTAGGVCLSSGVVVDVERVELLARQLEAGVTLDLAGVDASLFTQELLPGWSEVFADLSRESCRQLGLHAMESMARRLVHEGRPARALQVGLAAVDQSPLRETAHRVVIEIHLAEGNLAEAWRQFDLLSRMLWLELRVRPSTGLRDLLSAR
ncbi:AfsR/SARP family transcriptional regulator [Monashia sp. NPDC004114]